MKDMVLIETLWNVNKIRRMIYKPKRSFNRNIVECKCISPHLLRKCHFGFNRNIVECKFEILSGYKRGPDRFNRNIVECKYIFAPGP